MRKQQKVCEETENLELFPYSQLNLLTRTGVRPFLSSPFDLVNSRMYKCSLLGLAGTGICATVLGQAGRVWAGSPETCLVMHCKHTHLLGSSCFCLMCHVVDGSALSDTAGSMHGWLEHSAGYSKILPDCLPKDQAIPTSLIPPKQSSGRTLVIGLSRNRTQYPRKTQVCWVQVSWKMGTQVQERNQKPFTNSSHVLEKLRI